MEFGIQISDDLGTPHDDSQQSLPPYGEPASRKLLTHLSRLGFPYGSPPVKRDVRRAMHETGRLMEWLVNDPERGEPAKWWTIDPQTGQPDYNRTGEPILCQCLGESALEGVAMSADAIATTFATELFSDHQLRELIMRRIVPSSFKGGKTDITELLSLVDGLWISAEDCYQQALGRTPTDVERRWLYAEAFTVIRSRDKGRHA